MLSTTLEAFWSFCSILKSFLMTLGAFGRFLQMQIVVFKAFENLWKILETCGSF